MIKLFYVRDEIAVEQYSEKINTAAAQREAMVKLKVSIKANPRVVAKLVSPNKIPVYDEVYQAGVEMLDRN